MVVGDSLLDRPGSIASLKRLPPLNIAKEWSNKPPDMPTKYCCFLAKRTFEMLLKSGVHRPPSREQKNAVCEYQIPLAQSEQATQGIRW
jgi:hypothetical protein